MPNSLTPNEQNVFDVAAKLATVGTIFQPTYAQLQSGLSPENFEIAVIGLIRASILEQLDNGMLKRLR